MAQLITCGVTPLLMLQFQCATIVLPYLIGSCSMASAGSIDKSKSGEGEQQLLRTGQPHG